MYQCSHQKEKKKQNFDTATITDQDPAVTQIYLDPSQTGIAISYRFNSDIRLTVSVADGDC